MSRIYVESSIIASQSAQNVNSLHSDTYRSQHITPPFYWLLAIKESRNCLKQRTILKNNIIPQCIDPPTEVYTVRFSITDQSELRLWFLISSRYYNIDCGLHRWKSDL